MQTLWRAVRPLLGLVFGVSALCVAVVVLQPHTWAPRLFASQSGTSHTIYAYRQWQSVGVEVYPGDVVTLRASGQWAFSPAVKPHGPEGSREGVTATYPDPYASAGTLLARVGDTGEIAAVGRATVFAVRTGGRLYFRINDDLLGDNTGAVEVTVEIVRARSDSP